MLSDPHETWCPVDSRPGAGLAGNLARYQIVARAQALTCVIFDIDGTLIDSSAFESMLFKAAIEDVLGAVSIRSEWRDYEHVTDTGILRDIYRDNGLAIDGTELQIRERFGERVAAHLDDGGACPAVAGAIKLFSRLRSAAETEIGIATGGWAHTARMKLAYAGFDVRDIPFASSDDHDRRVGIMRHCRSGMTRGAQTIYVGDGEWDKQASERLGWRFIGVGEALRGKTEHWVPDLAELRYCDLTK